MLRRLLALNNWKPTMAGDDTYLVFVYGTLKRHQPNYHYMKSMEFISEAKSCIKYPLVIASKYNIPFAIDKPGTGFVSLSWIRTQIDPVFLNILFFFFKEIKGEIFRVDSSTLVKLDELENHPALYVRQLKPFLLPDGKEMEAWVYLLKKFKPEMLELEFYESYDSEGAHGKKYSPRYARETTVNTENIWQIEAYHLFSPSADDLQAPDEIDLDL